jgi:allantoin racemase
MMKRLLVINPNTSNLFTKRIAAVARRAAPELKVETVNPRSGPRSIESAYDELLSCAPTLETYLQARRSGPVDGVVVACFSDHAAIEALREISDGPVVGLLDAACATASLVGDTFGIATTSKSWEPLLRKGVDRLGYGDRCVDIRAIDMPVLALEHENVEQALLDTTAAIASDVVILGCAGFGSELARRTAAATGSSIVEPVEAAVRLCSSLALQGLRSSKSRPLAQQLDGLPEIMAEAYAPRGDTVAVAAPAEPEANRALALYRRALRAARRCIPGQAATQEAYARQSFRANVGADARRAPGLLADAEDQIAFGESLLRRREAEDSAPVAAAASTAADRVSPTPVASTPVAPTLVAPAPQGAPQEAPREKPRETPREADDLLAYDDYLDGDALDRRLRDTV